MHKALRLLIIDALSSSHHHHHIIIIIIYHYLVLLLLLLWFICYRNSKPSFSWRRIWKLNSPEAGLIVLGLLAVVVQGTIYPAFAVFFGQVLRVFTLPFNQVLGSIHVWAGMFLILGVLSGGATFVKVNATLVLTKRIRSKLF